VNQAHRQRALKALVRVVMAELRAGHLYQQEADALLQYLAELASSAAVAESKAEHGYVR
jgi:hypothetical protein